jgi:hypothetical protein
MSNNELDSELLAICTKMVVEAEAARAKYGEVLSPEEEFLLEAECEAIAEKAMKSNPEVWELARHLIAARVLEQFGDKEEWSDEKKIEEFLKMHPKAQ